MRVPFSISCPGEDRPARLLAAARVEVVLLGHHDLALEHADQCAVLVVALGLDVDHAAVVLGLGLPLVEHRGLAVDRVAVEGRRDVLQRLDLQVRDGLAGDVRHGHAEQQRVDVVADHDVLAELGGLPRVVRVQVQRVVVHGEQAEQVVVVLGHRLARPVLVARADLELLVAPPELHAASPACRHRWGHSVAAAALVRATGSERTRSRPNGPDRPESMLEHGIRPTARSAGHGHRSRLFPW